MSENTERRYLKWYNKVGYGSGDVAGNVVYSPSQNTSRMRFAREAFFVISNFLTEIIIYLLKFAIQTKIASIMGRLFPLLMQFWFTCSYFDFALIRLSSSHTPCA